MQQLQSIKKILAISACLLVSPVFADSIGDIIEQTGLAALTRNQQDIDAYVDQEILLYDLLNTGNGELCPV